MKIKLLLIAGLISFICQGQVYKIDKKEVRSSVSWRTDDISGYITINEREISITENGIVKGFLVDKVEEFGDDYMKYSCTDQNHKRVKIITVGFNKSHEQFKVLVSYPSVYYRYCLIKI